MKTLKKYVYMSPETEILSLETKSSTMQTMSPPPTEGDPEEGGWGAPVRF